MNLIQSGSPRDEQTVAVALKSVYQNRVPAGVTSVITAGFPGDRLTTAAGVWYGGVQDHFDPGVRWKSKLLFDSAKTALLVWILAAKPTSIETVPVV